MSDRLTVAQACKELGIGRTTFYEWQRKGLIRYSQPGGRNSNVYVTRQEIERLHRQQGGWAVK